MLLKSSIIWLSFSSHPGFGVFECNLKTYPSRWHHNDIHTAETCGTPSIGSLDNCDKFSCSSVTLKNCVSFLVPQLCSEWDTSAQNYAINSLLSPSVLFHLTVTFQSWLFHLGPFLCIFHHFSVSLPSTPLWLHISFCPSSQCPWRHHLHFPWTFTF